MGGWKSQRTVGVKLDPATVKIAIDTFLPVIKQFNSFLAAAGEQPIDPQRPVGSVSYHTDDAIENPGKTYGDIDYLVSFPCQNEDDATTRRQIENSVKREYQALWIDFLKSVNPKSVDVEATTKSSPWLVIINLPDGRAVQVDIIITFPMYCKWMGGRYEPERDKKGLIMGQLYKALGDVLMLSIGTEGVIARLKDGMRVSSNLRKGVELETVTTDIDNFLIDIAKYLAKSENIKIHPDLKKFPGVSSGSVSLEKLAQGIRGLGYTLESARVVTSAQDFLNKVFDNYQTSMSQELNSNKYKKAETPDQFAVIDKIGKQISTSISQVANILVSNTRTESILRTVRINHIR